MGFPANFSITLPDLHGRYVVAGNRWWNAPDHPTNPGEYVTGTTVLESEGYEFSECFTEWPEIFQPAGFGFNVRAGRILQLETLGWGADAINDAVANLSVTDLYVRTQTIEAYWADEWPDTSGGDPEDGPFWFGGWVAPKGKYYVQRVTYAYPGSVNLTVMLAGWRQVEEGGSTVWKLFPLATAAQTIVPGTGEFENMLTGTQTKAVTVTSMAKAYCTEWRNFVAFALFVVPSDILGLVSTTPATAAETIRAFLGMYSSSSYTRLAEDFGQAIGGGTDWQIYYGGIALSGLHVRLGGSLSLPTPAFVSPYGPNMRPLA